MSREGNAMAQHNHEQESEHQHEDNHEHAHGHEHNQNQDTKSSHSHAHSHGAHVHGGSSKGEMKKAILLASTILIIEVLGGIISNSLALISDAGHMLTDVASLLIAFYAIHKSEQQPNARMTYGYHRSGVLAALINALSLLVITVVIAWEAYDRIVHPTAIENSSVLFITASIGLVFNLYIGWSMKGHEKNINIKSAMLHILGDAVISAGVLLSGIIIYFTNWYLLDPIISFLIAIVIGMSSWRILKETFFILMESTPEHLSFEQVARAMKMHAQVLNVHDLHIWSLTPERIMLSAHVVIRNNVGSEVNHELQEILRHKFGISHVTLQIEHQNEVRHSTDMFSMDIG
ncbi:cation diffusion facilitator family transporter [Tepidibacillus sp. HK-1]|uniref:cation diffusion facilitator family transporter n=1 Tax=Tepidibacillus sp. HK-1 TaxID=1883407 RepID=UPI0008563A79|nr:cation diffusion facilitator family transporter [Tepidibacillus sp. HK-1]GBF10473.1 cadmium, cobalt and zinc/H(+)-K(+) antiporter [Tepidibacillus sp. HK-1]